MGEEEVRDRQYYNVLRSPRMALTNIINSWERVSENIGPHGSFDARSPRYAPARTCADNADTMYPPKWSSKDRCRRPEVELI